MDTYFDPWKQGEIVFRNSEKIHDTQTIKYFEFANSEKVEHLKNPYGISKNCPETFQAFAVRLKSVNQPRSLERVHRAVFKRLEDVNKNVFSSFNKVEPTDKLNKKSKKHIHSHSLDESLVLNNIGKGLAMMKLNTAEKWHQKPMYLKTRPKMKKRTKSSK